jgi:hypothetical protein
VASGGGGLERARLWGRRTGIPCRAAGRRITGGHHRRRPMRGVVLAPPVTASGGPSHGGLRLCLGAPERLDDLRRGLAVVAGILDEGGGRELV